MRQLIENKGIEVTVVSFDLRVFTDPLVTICHTDLVVSEDPNRGLHPGISIVRAPTAWGIRKDARSSTTSARELGCIAISSANAAHC